MVKKKRTPQRKPAEPGVPIGPLLNFFGEAKLKDPGYNQSQFARDNNFTPAQITNWKKRGVVPLTALDRVAAGMGLSHDAYLAQITGKRRQATVDASLLITDYDALPDGLKEIVARKAYELRSYYEACSPLVKKLLHQRPNDPIRSKEWEQDIEADMARLLTGRDKGDTI